MLRDEEGNIPAAETVESEFLVPNTQYESRWLHGSQTPLPLQRKARCSQPYLSVLLLLLPPPSPEDLQPQGLREILKT